MSTKVIRIALRGLDPGDPSVGIPSSEFKVEVNVGDCDLLDDPEQRAFLEDGLKELFTSFVDTGTVLLENEYDALMREEAESELVLAGIDQEVYGTIEDMASDDAPFLVNEPEPDFEDAREVTDYD